MGARKAWFSTLLPSKCNWRELAVGALRRRPAAPPAASAARNRGFDVCHKTSTTHLASERVHYPMAVWKAQMERAA